MNGNSQVTQNYLRLRDEVLGYEDYLCNILSHLPLAYLRFKHLEFTKTNIGYVRILKAKDSNAHLHPELGWMLAEQLGIDDIALAWEAAQSDDDRRAALNAHLNHTPDHEVQARCFLSFLMSGRSEALFGHQPCCGCFRPLLSDLDSVHYDGVQFCRECANELSSGLVNFDILDQFWLGVIPEWEGERFGDEGKILILDDTPLHMEPQRVDVLTRIIHWTVINELNTLKLTSEGQMRQNYCQYELGRLEDLLARLWPRWHRTEREAWKVFPLNIYGLQFVDDQEVQGRLTQSAFNTKGARLLIRGAYDSDDRIPAWLPSSASIRELFGTRETLQPLSDFDLHWMCTPQHRLEKMCADERASRMTAIDRLFERRIADEIRHQSQRDDFNYYNVWLHLESLIRDAVEKEILDIYDKCAAEPWREFIQLVHYYDDPSNADPRDHFPNILQCRDLQHWLEGTKPDGDQRGWEEFAELFYTLPQELALSTFLMREAETFWALYMDEDRFTAKASRFFRNHTVFLLRKHDFIKTGTIPTWAADMANTHVPSFNFVPESRSFAVHGLNVSRGGQLAWICMRPDSGCHCASMT